MAEIRSLVLSATELKALVDWPDALIEDYLNILRNLANFNDEIGGVVDDVDNNTQAINSINNSLAVILSAYLKSASYTDGVATFTDQDDSVLDLFVTNQHIVLSMGAAQSVDGAAKVALNFNSSIKDNTFTHTDGTADITVNSSGRYRINGYISIEGTTASYRYTGQTQIFINGIGQTRNIDSGYIRASSGSDESALLVGDTLDLNSGDIISIRVARVSTTAGNATTKVNGTWIEIERIQ